MNKQIAINKASNRILVKLYVDKGVTTCEGRFPGCLNNQMLSFAHRHKRIYYRIQPKRLSDFKQTLLLCLNCHEKIEYDRELTEELFIRLRGEEDAD